VPDVVADSPVVAASPAAIIAEAAAPTVSAFALDTPAIWAPAAPTLAEDTPGVTAPVVDSPVVAAPTVALNADASVAPALTVSTSTVDAPAIWAPAAPTLAVGAAPADAAFVVDASVVARSAAAASSVVPSGAVPDPVLRAELAGSFLAGAAFLPAVFVAIPVPAFFVGGAAAAVAGSLVAAVPLPFTPAATEPLLDWVGVLDSATPGSGAAVPGSRTTIGGTAVTRLDPFAAPLVGLATPARVVLAFAAGPLAALDRFAGAFFAAGFETEAVVDFDAGAEVAALVAGVTFAAARVVLPSAAAVCAGMPLSAAFRTASARSAMVIPHMQNGRKAGRLALRRRQEYGTLGAPTNTPHHCVRIRPFCDLITRRFRPVTAFRGPTPGSVLVRQGLAGRVNVRRAAGSAGRVASRDQPSVLRRS
jgi:hypothetical protein